MAEYIVTEDGHVFNAATGYELTQHTDIYGYKIVKMNGKMKKVHRLVALQYIPNPDNKPTVNHIDGDKSNNTVTNLEWATQAEQQLHAISIGARKDCTNRVSVAQFKDGVLCNTYKSLKEAEKQTGIHWTGISACIRGKRKSAGGYTWERR